MPHIKSAPDASRVIMIAVCVLVVTVLGTGCSNTTSSKANTSISDLSKNVNDLLDPIERLHAAFSVDSETAHENDLLMFVEDIFVVNGVGTVAAGRIARGTIKTGDEVEIVGLMETSKTIVKGLVRNEKTMQKAIAGEVAGLVLGDIGEEEIYRGQAIAKPGSIKSCTKFDAGFHILTNKEGELYQGGAPNTPLLPGQRVLYSLNVYQSFTMPAYLKVENAEKAVPGTNVKIQVELDQPMALERGMDFTLLERGRTVGYGVVTKALD